MRSSSDYSAEIKEIANEVCCIDHYKDGGDFQSRDPMEVLEESVRLSSWIQTSAGQMSVMQMTNRENAFFKHHDRSHLSDDFWGILEAFSVAAMCADVQDDDAFNYSMIREIREIR